jgi:hypothetical protein
LQSLAHYRYKPFCLCLYHSLNPSEFFDLDDVSRTMPWYCLTPALCLPRGTLNDALWTSDGRHIVFGCSDKSVTVFGVDGQKRHTFSGWFHSLPALLFFI